MRRSSISSRLMPTSPCRLRLAACLAGPSWPGPSWRRLLGAASRQPSSWLALAWPASCWRSGLRRVGLSSDGVLLGLLGGRQRLGRLATEVGRDDLGVVLHLRRRALGEHPAEVEDVDVVADPEHQRDVVLDDEHRQAELAAQRQQPLAELVGLVRPHARGRLVEQQDVGVGRERAAELEQLQGAVGLAADPLVADRRTARAGRGSPRPCRSWHARRPSSCGRRPGRSWRRTRRGCAGRS